MRGAAAGAVWLVVFLVFLTAPLAPPPAAQGYNRSAAEGVPPVEAPPPEVKGRAAAAVPAPTRRPATAEERKAPADPALSDQCSWIGTRIISLLMRDDAMTADDFMPFYAKFGCPDPHLARAFGCLVANAPTLETSALADQAEECWRDPQVRYVPLAEDKGTADAGRPKAEGGKANGPPPAGNAPPRAN